jgi:hypothetical protein
MVIADQPSDEHANCSWACETSATHARSTIVNAYVHCTPGACDICSRMVSAECLLYHLTPMQLCDALAPHVRRLDPKSIVQLATTMSTLRCKHSPLLRELCRAAEYMCAVQARLMPPRTRRNAQPTAPSACQISHDDLGPYR